MTRARQVSYLLFGLLGAGIVGLHLGPAMLAALFSFMILDLAHRTLARSVPELLSRWAALLFFIVLAVGLSWMFGFFVKLSLTRIPIILASLIPQLDSFVGRYGIDLPFENLDEFRIVIVEAIKENARSITQASGLLTRGFFQVLVGAVISVLVFFTGDDPEREPQLTLFAEIKREFNTRVVTFLKSFELVFGAQLVIALINTAVTAVFLLAVGMPYFPLLVLATFIFGAIPVLGNVISNAIIVSTALTVSPRLAVAALVFLVLVHKLEYFLNSRVVGARTDMAMWQILTGLLVGEIALGLPGMILASAILHYAREELRAIPAAAVEPRGRARRA